VTRSTKIAALHRTADALEPSAGSAPCVLRRAIGDRLDVVVVCDHAHISGGLAQVAHASARALSRRGHRVVFFAAVPPIDPALVAAGVEVVCLDQPDILGDHSRWKAASRALWNARAGRRLAELLATLDPCRSIVHLHGWSKALSPSVLRAGRRSGAATVHTLHDYVAVCPNGALFNYVDEQNCDLRPMSAGCILSNCDARHYGHKLWRVARHFALMASGEALDGQHVIYISKPQREILAPLLPVGTYLHYVPNPVDVSDHGPANVAANDTFVFIGRLSREKGTALFAEAVKRAGIKAIFVGDGPMRQAVLETSPSAAITGWVNNVDVTKHLRNARALVFPSLWHETFGLSVYEALANGVPPIVSDNTTSSEAVEHGANGLLFRSGDVDDLIACIQTLSDGGTAGRIGRTAYDRYWACPPTLECHIDRLEELYRRLLSRRTDRARASMKDLTVQD
jgi:glycosyltransferase involved in cell wall biosynthesis